MRFGLRKKSPSRNFGQEWEISVGALRTPPPEYHVTLLHEVCGVVRNISKKQNLSCYRISTRKGIINIQTNENIFGEVGCPLVLVIIILVWGCCYVGTGVEMVPNLKSKKDLTTLR